MTRGLVQTFCTVITTLLLGLGLGLGTAHADKPNSKYAGRIMMSEKRYPSSAKSVGEFNAKVAKQSKTAFYEDKDKHEWKLQFIGFLKQPLNDVEYLVKIYELGKGQNLLLASFEQFTDQRGMTSLISSMTLERKLVGVNKNLMMTMEHKGKVLASTRFKILGEGEKFSGKVNFSDDDANGKSDDE